MSPTSAVGQIGVRDGAASVPKRKREPRHIDGSDWALATFHRLAARSDWPSEDMIEMLGRQEYDEMQAERRLAIAAIDGGLLRRSLFIAHRPQRI